MLWIDKNSQVDLIVKLIEVYLKQRNMEKGLEEAKKDGKGL